MPDRLAARPKLIHVPYGIEDPYTPQAWERAPREPREGDAVSVYVVTRPQGAVSRVAVNLRSSTEPSRVVDASPLLWSDEGDRWEAKLGSFPAGAEVIYHVEAFGCGEQTVLGPYAFEVVGWTPLVSASTYESTGAQASMRLRDTAGNEALAVVEFLERGVVRLRVWPFAPPVALVPHGLGPAAGREQGGQVSIAGADLEVRVGLADASITISRRNQAGVALPIASSPPEQPFLAWLGARSSSPQAVRLCLSLADDEAIFGTGERFDSLDRRGLSFDARVYEQYKNQGSRTYMPVPMVLSSRGYAVSLSGTRPLRFDVGATRKDALAIEGDVARDGSACLEVTFFLADTPLAALQGYLRHGGMPALPPDWAFGLWMSSNDWNSQERVMRAVERTERERIPAEVLVVEAWSDEATFYIWNDAECAPLSADRPPRLADFHFPSTGRWPDPSGMVKALHEKGMRILLWQIPLIKQMEEPYGQNAADAETVISRGWCARNPDGSPYRSPGWWFTGALLPDLTHPQAVSWWLSRRRYLVEELGVDGFKTDGGEHLWGRDVMFADGRRGDEMINAFPVLYAAAYHQLLRDCGRDDGLTFSRAGYAGSQRYPAHWAGDESSTWEAFRHSIVAGLSAGASGIPFWGWDIAGFSEEIPSGELYRRSWMMAAFCPIMQYHSEYNARREPSRDRTPWNIAERTGDQHVLPVCRFYARVRRTLRPYILREARHTAETGRPLMCALPLAYPDDLRCRAYPYQYLFGRDLLVAPTVEEGAVEQQVYLPAGRWADLWTGESVEGSQEITVEIPADRIPVFVRDGALPPLDRPWRDIS